MRLSNVDNVFHAPVAVRRFRPLQLNHERISSRAIVQWPRHLLAMLALVNHSQIQANGRCDPCRPGHQSHSAAALNSSESGLRVRLPEHLDDVWRPSRVIRVAAQLDPPRRRWACEKVVGPARRRPRARRAI